MKTFPTNFNTEKNKKTGASPVWILKCPFPSSGTKYLSDQAFSLPAWNGGITTLSWVKRWGIIDESISNELAISQVSDFELDLINDPNASPNIDTILWTAANNIETTDCELYLWFRGLDDSTDAPQKMWTGNIVDFEKVDELTYSMRLVDQSVRLDKYVGTVIEAGNYPNADPDEVGKIGNIVYGPTKRVRCHAIKAGAVDSIVANITATNPGNGGTLNISDASGFPDSGAFTIQIDDEQIRIASRSGNACTLAASNARGYNSTTATSHSKGAACFQVLTEYIYLIADHPVKTLGSVYVDDVRQTSGFTTYTGQSGDEHASYPGKAVVAFAVKAIIKKQVNIDIDTGSHSHTASSVKNYYPNNSTNSLPPSWVETGAINNIRDLSDFTSYKQASNGNSGTGSINAYYPSYTGPTPSAVYACITHKTVVNAPAYVQFHGTNINTSGVTVTQKYHIGTSVPSGSTVNMFANGDNGLTCEVFEVWLEIHTTSTGSSAATGVGLASSSNSSADTVIGQVVAINVDGYQDDASGTFTGTADSLIKRPGHVFKHFLSTYAGIATANFNTDANTYFNTNGYEFAIVINERKKLKEWLVSMAWQCRSYFRFSAGKAYLTLRPDSLSSQKSITANMIRMQEDGKTTTKIRRSPLEEIINKIKIYYNRDWLKTGEEAYKAISSTSDATSITRYGEKERKELFFFDLVRSSTMADHVRDFYLARYKDRKKLLEFDLFLDNSELEFADNITIVPQSSLICEIQKANCYPGSGKDMRNDRITILVKEY